MDGGKQYPSIKMLKKIGQASGIPLGYFFQYDGFLKSLDPLPNEMKDLWAKASLPLLLHQHRLPEMGTT